MACPVKEDFHFDHLKSTTLKKLLYTPDSNMDDQIAWDLFNRYQENFSVVRSGRDRSELRE